MIFSEYTLANGMRLVSVPMPSLNSVTVLAMVNVGSRYEDPKLAGISHFLEHLPFKGTKKYPSSLALAEAVDGVGGKHNAFTGKEYTGYWVKVASGKLALALDIVSDLLLQPLLPPEEIEKERGVIIEEINMYEDEPRAKVANLFDDLVYQGSGLQGDVIGTKATVGGIKLEDFLKHYQQWYAPENVVIGVAGGVEQATLAEQVESAFSKGEKRAGGGKQSFGLPEQKSPRIHVFQKDTEQAHFFLGYPSVSRKDPARWAQSIFTTLLGGNSSSKLFNEIREKRGLAYYAYASMDLYHDAGSLYALEGVAINKVEEAIKVTLEEFSLAASGETITDKAVAAAKEYLIGKTTLDLEDSASMASFVVRKALLDGKAETVEDAIQKIKAVTVDEVKQVAQRVLNPNKLNLSLIGPFADSDKFAGLLEA
jgi:predicted Zn-dependent peptidase